MPDYVIAACIKLRMPHGNYRDLCVTRNGPFNMHYLCLIREIVSWILTLVIIQHCVIIRVVIQLLNHEFTLNYDRVCFSWEGVCSYHGLIYSLPFFLLTVKAPTDLIKRVLSRVIIPGRIMARVVNQCRIFTPGHNSTWNYDPFIIIPPVEYGG